MFQITPYLPAFRIVTTQPTITVAPVLLVAPDPTRACLYITNPASSNLLLWMQGQPTPAGQPQFVATTNDTVAFTWLLDGPFATFGWMGSYPAGPNTCYVTQLLWQPESLGVNT